jgi:hypothetical protein
MIAAADARTAATDWRYFDEWGVEEEEEET